MQEEKLTAQDIWALFKETDRQFKETAQRFNETDRQFKETAQNFKETDQKIKKLTELFTGQWGKLIESLATSGILEIFQERGVKISYIFRRVEGKKNGRKTEYDFLLTNDTEIVVGEVKTTLSSQDVKDFLEKLRDFQSIFPKFKGCKVYGAVIGIRIDENADRYAYRQGLFVLTVGSEDLVKLLNDEKFIPVNFGDDLNC